MRVLVTGGAGFVGSHLVDRLLDAGHHVVCVDNFHTGRRSNVAQHQSNPRFSLIEHDVVNPLAVAAEQIYHLACPASPPHYQADPVHTMKTCVLGTLNMLEVARTNQARILLASTSEVYGDPQEHPQRESYRGNVNPIGPRACYDEGKRAAETLCFDFQRMHRTDIRVVRIFNTYGPRMLPDDGRVVSNFIIQALKGAPITLYGTGNQTRSFCYVDDLVSGLMAMMNGAETGPINFGNPDEFTVHELAKMVLEKTKSPSLVEHRPLPQDDPTRRKPDISLATRKLGWAPTIPLNTGLQLTIDYFRSAQEDAK